MTSASNKMISDFTGKPTTQSFFTAIAEYTASLGQVAKDAKAQVSFSVNRKFLWLWAYEKTADGTLYLNVTLDQKIDDPHFHNVSQVSTNRWNHHVEVKSEVTANSDWLHDLIRQGFEFARR
ncbi:hypothetical protein GCE65_02960 [Pseudactinotalea sp. HY158]|nr:hypothetical protein GCE65_02960 [Pseudactinotalea sp. HY158]